jgi:hypothetical protein
MTDRAADPTGRRRLLVRSLMARRGQSDRLVVHAAEHSEAPDGASGSERSEGKGHASRAAERTLRYGDRELELRLREGERPRLDDLLDDYPVFKIDAPATRKAPDGEVCVAAVADPKHLADFIEDCCRRVYGLDEGFVLRVA